MLRRWPLAFILLVAFVLRAATWRAMGGPRVAGDGPAYVEWAQRIAAGDLSGFRDYPLHQLYPALLAPAFSLGLPFGPYALLLHLALSLGTVFFLHDACRQFASQRAALACAALAAAYPSLLLWSPYVLSETPFFFFLSLFVALLARALARREGRQSGRLALLALSGVLILFARPVSLAILAVGGLAVGYALLADRMDARPARRITFTSAALVVLAMAALLAFDPPLRQAVLRYPTVAQSLWLSTVSSSSSVAEWAPIAEQNRAFAERYSGDFDALYEHKVDEAVTFIRTDPGQYALLAVRRFTSYWLPALFADGWSRAHRVFDLVLIVALCAGAAASLWGLRDRVRGILFAAAIAFGLLTSFSQIDTDGRYRVPAELILLMLAADGYARLLVIGLHQLRPRAIRDAMAEG